MDEEERVNTQPHTQAVEVLNRDPKENKATPSLRLPYPCSGKVHSSQLQGRKHY